jgi:hypothetical protein
MAERHHILTASDHPLMRLVQAVSCELEAVKLLEVAGLDRVVAAARVKSPDTAANLVFFNRSVPGISGFNGLLLVGALPEFI